MDTLPTYPAEIFSDSLSSLMAIQDRNSNTPLVIEIQNLLVQLRLLGMNTTVTWVKAHVGIIGNERADQLAKSCWISEAELVNIDAPLSFCKRQIKLAERSKWNTDWKKAKNGSWTRRIFPTVEHRRRAGAFSLDFVLTQFLSGHGKFGSYLHRFNIRGDPSCQCGAHQDPEHLIFDCTLMADLRETILAECASHRIQFELSSLGKLLASNSTRAPFLSFLQSAHRRLVLWED